MTLRKLSDCDLGEDAPASETSLDTCKLVIGFGFFEVEEENCRLKTLNTTFHSRWFQVINA